MSKPIYGIIMIILGIVYIVKPNIFKIGIWKKTAVSQQVFNPKQYNLYMRILGVVFIAIGVYEIFFANRS